MQAANPTIKISTAGIISKPHSEKAASVVPALVEWLAERGVGVRCDPKPRGIWRRARALPREACQRLRNC